MAEATEALVPVPRPSGLGPAIDAVFGLAEQAGVEVLVLPFHPNHGVREQGQMRSRYGAHRAPCELFRSYASMGDPTTGTRGTLFVPPLDDSSWEPPEDLMEAVDFFSQEVVLLHELAHCVVGLHETLTYPWEREACELLFGKESPQWSSTLAYEPGDQDDEEIAATGTCLYAEGLMPSQLMAHPKGGARADEPEAAR